MVLQADWRHFPPSSKGDGKKLTLDEWIKEFYIELLENDWKLNNIDDMDIYFYLDLLLYRAQKEYNQNVEAVLNIL